ncbi:MAG: hypothetical protein N2313_09250 [Meiothermus ruber]|mgnify:CR=1 FL=1|jgi:hypothetical protein|nr:hypothetical protein [Meiothermus ruber]
MKNWKAKAQQAFERYLEDLEQSLAPGVGLAGIEAAMLRHNPELLRAVMQGLAEETQALSPPGDTAGVAEGGGSVGRGAESVGKDPDRRTAAAGRDRPGT